MDTIEIILIVYGFLLVLSILSFLEQRAELEIGRMIGIDIRLYIMPIWCAISAYILYLEIPLYIYTFFIAPWYYAVSMAAVSFLLPTMVSFIYLPYENTYKNLAKYLKKNKNTIEGLAIEEALISSNLYYNVKKYL